MAQTQMGDFQTNRLFDSEAGSDVIFLVGHEPETWRFPGHRSVLCNSNPVFKAMLENFQECGTEQIITIKDVDGRAFDVLLRFLYKEDVVIQSVATALSTLYAAQKYLCMDLMRECIVFLDGAITTGNVLQIYEHLRVHSGQRVKGPSAPTYEVMLADTRPEEDFNTMLKLLDSLLFNTLLFIDLNAEEILSQESIEDLTVDSLKEILERDTLDVREALIYSTIERWSNRECKRCHLELSQENRRTVLELCAVFLFLMFPLKVASAPSDQPKIIIVGAGVSGIAAATRLIENGFTNLKILEAEDRIGGRVHSVTTGNWTVDLGGHWVHGEAGNVVYEIAAPLKLLDSNTKVYANEILVFSDKHELNNVHYSWVERIYEDPEINTTQDSLYNYMKRHEKSQGPAINLDGKLHLNMEVTKIVQRDGGIDVLCKDGSNFTADLVIVTVSLAVLKERHESLFHPTLPQYKKLAIYSLGIGVVDKIILRFPHIWWPANVTGFEIVWLEKDKILEKGQFPWELEITSFSTEDGSPFTLTGWMSGLAARDMEKYSIDDIGKGSMRVLKAFLKHKYSIPEPVEVLRSKWGTNPHFRGSYSYPSVASEVMNITQADLAQPVTNKIGKEVILFAGEATNSKHFGTVHGAVESGWREADRIIKAYKN